MTDILYCLNKNGLSLELLELSKTKKTGKYIIMLWVCCSEDSDIKYKWYRTIVFKFYEFLGILFWLTRNPLWK